MSLIPSESQSFPDDFSRTISRARVLNEKERFVRAVKPQPRAKVAAPSPRPSAPRAVRLTPAARIPAKVIVDLAENVEAETDTPTEVMDTPALRVDATVKKEVRLKRRRRSRMWHFLICELMALGLLGGCVIVALSHRFTEPTMMALNTVTLVVAFVTVVIPILFFAFRQTQPWLED